MSPTPTFGLRFPDSADDLNVGAINIQQLAEDVEAALAEHTRPRYFGSADGVATMPVNTWTPLTFTAPIMSADFTLAGDGTYATYTGDPGRFFTWTGSAVVSSGFDVSSKELRLVRNGTAYPNARALGSTCSLSIATIAQLFNGDMLWVEVNAAALAGAAGSGYMTLLGGA